MQVQSTAAGKLQRGLAQAGRGYRCFVRGPLVAPLPMTLVSTRNVTRTCDHRTDAYDRCYENIVHGRC